MKIVRHRNSNIDVLRIFACIAVVGLHTLQRDISIINSSAYYLCGFAVPVFFACSGMMLLNRKTDYKYSIKKIVSILRLVVIWGSILLFAEYVLALLSNKNFTIDVFFVAKYLIRGLLQRGRLWQFWYLGASIIMYCIIPILCKIIYSEDTLRNDRLIGLWLTFFALCTGIQILSYLIGEPVQRKITQTFRIWSWIHYLLMGGVLGSSMGKQIINKFSVKKHIVVFCISTIVVIVLQNIFGKYVIHNTYAEYFYDDPCMILWIFLLVSLVLRIEIKEKYKGIIEQYASVTFGVYIIHPLIRDSVNRAGVIFSVAGAFAYWILLTAVCFFVVELLCRNRFLRKLFTL